MQQAEKLESSFTSIPNITSTKLTMEVVRKVSTLLSESKKKYELLPISSFLERNSKNMGITTDNEICVWVKNPDDWNTAIKINSIAGFPVKLRQRWKNYCDCCDDY
jgi:uncharacterized protein YqgV (UPF0045/DUF77 family)